MNRLEESMNIRRMLLICCALFWSGSVWGQVVSARSNTGPLPVVGEGGTSASINKNLLTLEVEFTDPSGDGFLDAKETGRLRIIMTNTGRSVVRGIVAKIIPKTDVSGLTYIDSIKVGDVPVSATQYAIFYFTAATAVRSQTVTFRVEILNGSGDLAAEPRLLTFVTRELLTTR
jgi:hypothetical protein